VLFEQRGEVTLVHHEKVYFGIQRAKPTDLLILFRDEPLLENRQFNKESMLR
jgi:hypothetical protein